MSTTPTTFRKRRASYTVIGGPRADRIRKITSPLAVVLLARGGRFYRQELLEALQEHPWAEVLSIEGPGSAYDLQPLSQRYPEVRFLLLQEQASAGERINLGIAEARSPLVLVLWSDMKPEPWVFGEEARRQALRQERLCIVPQLKGGGGEVLPSLQIPAWIKGRLKMLPWKPAQEGMKSLFPYDYCGLYSSRKFRQLGGYDSWMANPYWQKLDFGFRAFLWGETICCQPRFQVTYATDPPAEDSTPDPSYKAFFLKNLAVQYNGELGLLPWSQLPRYVLKSDSGFLYALREFREVRRWVYENRYRFKGEASSLISRWEMPE
jgi:hypothetical protein